MRFHVIPLALLAFLTVGCAGLFGPRHSTARVPYERAATERDLGSEASTATLSVRTPAGFDADALIAKLVFPSMSVVSDNTSGGNLAADLGAGTKETDYRISVEVSPMKTTLSEPTMSTVHTIGDNTPYTIYSRSIWVKQQVSIRVESNRDQSTLLAIDEEFSARSLFGGKVVSQYVEGSKSLKPFGSTQDYVSDYDLTQTIAQNRAGIDRAHQESIHYNLLLKLRDYRARYVTEPDLAFVYFMDASEYPGFEGIDAILNPHSTADEAVIDQTIATYKDFLASELAAGNYAIVGMIELNLSSLYIRKSDLAQAKAYAESASHRDGPASSGALHQLNTLSSLPQ